jgi:hypothetical protein
LGKRFIQRRDRGITIVRQLGHFAKCWSLAFLALFFLKMSVVITKIGIAKIGIAKIGIAKNWDC